MKIEKIKEFYKITKFKLITTIILFAVIMLPALVYDDIYYAAPWIWFILNPATLLDRIYADPWIAMLTLTILWFYTIASIIEKVRKSK